MFTIRAPAGVFAAALYTSGQTLEKPVALPIFATRKTRLMAAATLRISLHRHDVPFGQRRAASQNASSVILEPEQRSHNPPMFTTTGLPRPCRHVALLDPTKLCARRHRLGTFRSAQPDCLPDLAPRNGHPAATRGGHTDQSSSTSPGTRAKSRRFRATRINWFALAIEAIFLSWVPIRTYRGIHPGPSRRRHGDPSLRGTSEFLPSTHRRWGHPWHGRTNPSTGFSAVARWPEASPGSLVPGAEREAAPRPPRASSPSHEGRSRPAHGR